MSGLNVKQKAIEALNNRKSISLTDFVLIWEYAHNEPHNQSTLNKFNEVHKLLELETRSNILIYNDQLQHEKSIFLHWATLSKMLSDGYTATMSVSGHIEIRRKHEDD